MTFSGNGSFASALRNHAVHAEVIDIDYNREYNNETYHTETRYVTEVKATSREHFFETFRFSKTYQDFRSLKSKLKEASKLTLDKCSDQDVDCEQKKKNVINASREIVYSSSAFSNAFKKGWYKKTKLSFESVKAVSKSRKKEVNNALIRLLETFPSERTDYLGVETFFVTVIGFFLTDHLEDEGEDKTLADSDSDPDSEDIFTPDDTTSRVVAQSIRLRPSVYTREKIKKELHENGELIPVDQPGMFDIKDHMVTLSPSSPLGLFSIFSMMVLFFASISGLTVTLNADMLIIIIFAVFKLSAYLTPVAEDAQKPVVSNKAKSEIQDTTALNKRSLVSSALADTELLLKRTLSTSTSIQGSQIFFKGHEIASESIVSPLPVFPVGAKLGSAFNCWSEPPCAGYEIRGPDYLTNKKKISSGSYIFPARGVDFFLTDNCPDNIGRFKSVMGGKLRTTPSFVLNLRLPWGVLATYHEIPKKFLPFLRHGQQQSDPPSSTPPKMDGMTPSEVCVCRFLMGSTKHRNSFLKMIPSVPKGPWIVKNAVGNKPVLVGKKIPIAYVYQPADSDSGAAEYLEVVVDIVASAKARGILAICRKYTNVLTFDLGFVIQGEAKDELPEQMLTAVRLHGIDPLTASVLPDE